MKKIYLGLAFLILILQARLLSSDGGLGELFLLQEQLKKLEASLEEQRIINVQLAQQVSGLQADTTSIETIARQTLGMVKKDEVFIKVIELKQPDPIQEEDLEVSGDPEEQGSEGEEKDSLVVE